VIRPASADLARRKYVVAAAGLCFVFTVAGMVFTIQGSCSGVIPYGPDKCVELAMLVYGGFFAIATLATAGIALGAILTATRPGGWTRMILLLTAVAWTVVVFLSLAVGGIIFIPSAISGAVAARLGWTVGRQESV
jgi:hypothetical protein